MKVYIVCFLLIFGCFTNPISAQNDSLITALEKILKVQLDSLGEEHLNVAMYCDSLGKMYRDAGVYDKANALFIKALLIKVKEMGMNHYDVGSAYHNLASVYYLIKDKGKTDFFYTKAMNVWNNNDYDFKKIYRQFDSYEAAKEYFEKILETDLEYFGENNLIVALDYDYLGWVYYALDDYQKAKEYYQKVLNIKLDNLGEDHLEVANACHKLATIYLDMNEYDRAKKYYEKVLNIKSNNLAPFHIDIADAYLNLAMVCTRLEDYEAAKEYHEETLDIRLIHLHEYHIDIADAYHDLADICMLLRYDEKAREYDEKARDIEDKNKLSLANDIDKNHRLHESNIVFRRKMQQKIEKYWTKALKIDSDNLSKNYHNLASYHGSLSGMYRAWGEYEKANYHHQKMKDIRKYKK